MVTGEGRPLRGFIAEKLHPDPVAEEISYLPEVRTKDLLEGLRRRSPERRGLIRTGFGVPRKQIKRATLPRFELSSVGSALEDAKQVPVVLRARLTGILERLAAEGCRAADYALSGPPPWPHLCAVHFDGWRVVVAFPTRDEVTIVKIARHDPAGDPYGELARDLRLPVSTEPRTKPPCCDPEGEPPVAAKLVEDMRTAFAVLTQRERRQRSHRSRRT
ncbi:MAG: hypothetical protein ACT4OS_07845 [Acidimicrobiales bacterium]